MNPNFPVTTHAVWTEKPVDVEQVFHTKSLELANEGKTDNNPRVERSTVSHVYRDWIDEAAANEWIAFNNQVADPRLISITIAAS